MAVTIESSTCSVEFTNQPNNIVRSIGSTIDEYQFGDGTDARLNMGKNSDRVTMTYYCNQTDAWLADLEQLCDDGEEVAVSGLQDTNLNTTYLFSSKSVEQDADSPEHYKIVISLERTVDNLS